MAKMTKKDIIDTLDGWCFSGFFNYVGLDRAISVIKTLISYYDLFPERNQILIIELPSVIKVLEEVKERSEMIEEEISSWIRDHKGIK